MTVTKRDTAFVPRPCAARLSLEPVEDEIKPEIHDIRD